MNDYEDDVYSILFDEQEEEEDDEIYFCSEIEGLVDEIDF